MPTPSPVFGWPLPVLADVADGPDAFSDLGLAIEGTINNPNVLTYTPSWTADGTIQPVNPSTRVGYYQMQKKICHVYARIEFGASVGGGNGALRIGLPAPGKTGMIQLLNCWTFIPGNGHFEGLGEVRAGEQTVLPRFPYSPGNCTVAYWQSESVGGGIGTTIPAALSGTVRSVTNGAYIVINGSYIVN